MHVRKGFLAVAVAVTVWQAPADVFKLLPLPADQDVVRENGTLSLPPGSRARTLDLVPVGGFAVGRHYTFRLRGAIGAFAFVTGREYPVQTRRSDGTTETRLAPESMAFAPLIDRDSRVPHGIRAVEASARVTDARANSSSLALNYIMPAQTFATIDNVARWQEREAAALRQDLTQGEIRLGIAVTESELRFFVNGVYLRSLPRADGDNPAGVLRLQKETVAADTVDVESLSSRFFTLDITERLNAAGLPGLGTATNLPAGGEIVVQGVPFRLPHKRRFDHVDLAMSWMEAAMRGGYGITEVWTRWRAATDKVPLRYQFRVPFDAYDTLYVLAASDARPDTIPRFTAQVYLPRRGRPASFTSADIPAFTAEAEGGAAFPVLMANGQRANLHLVKVQLEPGQFTKFSRSDFFDMELTKDVQTYRAYPDPLTHSIHGAGLPSSVRVFAITFGRSSLKTTFAPDAFANVWHEGERAAYTVELENTTDVTQSARLEFRAVSYDGGDRYTDTADARVKPGETRTVRFRFRPQRFGHYTVALVKRQGNETQTFSRTLAHLRPREYGVRPFDAPGMFFGCWHVGSVDTVRLAGMMGFDGFSGLRPENEEALALMRRYGMQDFNGARIMRIGGTLAGNRDVAEDTRILQEKMPPMIVEPGPVNTPVYGAILCEPGGIGTGNAGFGEYYGEAPYDYTRLNERQAARYANYKHQFLTIRPVLKALAPDLRVMLPNGNWCFTIPFLQDPDTRHLMDGVKCDFQFYTRLPEQQMHQCSLHSLFYFRNAWNTYRPGETPLLVFGEGPDVSPVYPGASTEEVAAAHRVRCSIIMAGYGAHHQHAWATSIHQSGGENHCSGGFVDNEVSLNPELAYSAFATHTRHMRHAMFESYTNPGSFSAFCANFRNHQSGEIVRLLWTVRGTREFLLDAAPGALTVFDAMDNRIWPATRGGHSLLTVGPMPIYVYGTDERTAVSLGAADHGDARPGAVVSRLGNAVDLFTEQTADADPNYVEMMPEYIRRFQTGMATATVKADAAYGGQALSVTLPPQAVDRGLMPYYTCLKPGQPIPIAGKGSHLLLWVKAHSDWGRVVYVLRDAKGRLWHGVGMRGEWNGDDMPGDSTFCFDGWRLLRFELPANAPWDSFRELGLTCWGSDSPDNLVELPVALEKIFVERRSSVMYGNDRHAIPEEQPVLLGDLFVEYASEADMSDEVVRRSRIRAPQVPAGSLPNPIADLHKTGTLPAGRIVKVEDPDTWFDGTRGVFTFEMPTNAVAADIWLSLQADGRGALKQGRGLKQSPTQVSGFLADTEFHAFLVYTDPAGRTSIPSAPFPFKLIDRFSHQ